MELLFAPLPGNIHGEIEVRLSHFGVNYIVNFCLLGVFPLLLGLICWIYPGSAAYMRCAFFEGREGPQREDAIFRTSTSILFPPLVKLHTFHPPPLGLAQLSGIAFFCFIAGPIK